MIAPFFIAGFDTPSDLKLQVKIIQQGALTLYPGVYRFWGSEGAIEKEQHQVLLLQASNNDYDWHLSKQQGSLEKLFPPIILAIVSSSQRYGATGI